MSIKEYILGKVQDKPEAVRGLFYHAVNERPIIELEQLGFQFTNKLGDLAYNQPQKVISYTDISFMFYRGNIIYSEHPLDTIPLDILVEKEILDFKTAKQLVDKGLENLK